MLRQYAFNIKHNNVALALDFIYLLQTKGFTKILHNINNKKQSIHCGDHCSLNLLFINFSDTVFHNKGPSIQDVRTKSRKIDHLPPVRKMFALTLPPLVRTDTP